MILCKAWCVVAQDKDEKGLALTLANTPILRFSFCTSCPANQNKGGNPAHIEQLHQQHNSDFPHRPYFCPQNLNDLFFRFTTYIQFARNIETTGTMSITLEKILAAAPVTTRGQPTQLSADAKGERIAYAVSVQFHSRSTLHSSLQLPEAER